MQRGKGVPLSMVRFAVQNLVRSRTRTLLTVFGTVVATATLVLALGLDRGYRSAVDSELVRKTGIHIYVTREGCPMEAASIIAQGGISPLFVPETVTDAVRTAAHVDAAMPFKIFALTTADGSRTDIFFGITPEIRRIRPDWRISTGTWFTGDDSVILGAEIARLEKRVPGDRIYFDHFDREFTVTGILARSNSQDDAAFFLPLHVAQRLIGREGKLTAIAVKVDDLRRLEEVRRALRGMLPEDYFVITAQELSEGVMTFFASTRAIMGVMVLIALLLAVLGISNTMLMTVTERRREFGYLRCVGAGTGDIIRLIAGETFIVCAAGAVGGVAAASALVPMFERFIRSTLTSYIPAAGIVQLHAVYAAVSVAVVILVGVAASLYPALKAARIPPMEVVRDA